VRGARFGAAAGCSAWFPKDAAGCCRPNAGRRLAFPVIRWRQRGG